MRKTISLLLALMMLVTAVLLVACGETDEPVVSESQTEASKNEDTSTQTEPQPQESETEPPVTEPPATEPPATEPPETDPQESETEPPETEPPETDPPETDPPETDPPETDPPETDPPLTGPESSVKKAEDYADLDFGGKTFNIVYRWQHPSEVPSGWGMVFDCYIDQDNPDDAMSAAVKLRNSAMEEFYNCKITSEGSTNAIGVVNTAVDSGDAKYDLCIGVTGVRSFASAKTRYYNILNLINMDYDCWDQSLIRDLALAGKIYGMVGDCTTSDEDYSWAIYFNKAVLREHNIEYPYQLVHDGKWTLDKLYQMSRDCATELNGDNTYTSANDIQGLVARSETCRYFWQGAGVRIFSSVQEDGNVVFTGNSLGTEANIYADILKFLWDATTGGFKDPDTGHRCDYPDGLVDVFNKGHCAFMIEGLYVTSKNALNWSAGISDIEGLEWGILPCPKYTEEQSQYYNFVWTQCSFIGVPTTLNVKIASDFLNVYGLMTQATVQKTFNNNIGYAFAGDDEVVQMLEIIEATRAWDASYWFAESAIDANLISDAGVNQNRWAGRTKNSTKAANAVKEYYDYHNTNPN